MILLFCRDAEVPLAHSCSIKLVFLIMMYRLLRSHLLTDTGITLASLTMMCHLLRSHLLTDAGIKLVFLMRMCHCTTFTAAGDRSEPADAGPDQGNDHHAAGWHPGECPLIVANYGCLYCLKENAKNQ